MNSSVTLQRTSQWLIFVKRIFSYLLYLLIYYLQLLLVLLRDLCLKECVNLGGAGRMSYDVCFKPLFSRRHLHN
ncbi:hypothetical protein JXA85_02270 [Candidatus Woesearchaeota archaeon]|nr:hypothetical protein [Candidatus Woesearchaeota archaeon]